MGFYLRGKYQHNSGTSKQMLENYDICSIYFQCWPIISWPQVTQSKVIKMQQLKVSYDFQEKSLPDDLMDLFRLSTNVHTTNQTLNSALNNLIHIPKIKTVTYGNNSIRYHCAKLWNQMFRTGSFHINSNPENDVKLCKVNSIHYFKKKLKQHFLYEYSL